MVMPNDSKELSAGMPNLKLATTPAIERAAFVP